MPHFTVTKVEDPEEGAAGSVFPEPSSAEVKARIQDPQEPGESRACSFGDPQTSFREGASNLAISLRTVAHGADGKKACFLVVLLPVYLITSLSLFFFPHEVVCFFPHKEFSVSITNRWNWIGGNVWKEFSSKKKDNKSHLCRI